MTECRLAGTVFIGYRANGDQLSLLPQLTITGRGLAQCGFIKGPSVSIIAGQSLLIIRIMHDREKSV